MENRLSKEFHRNKWRFCPSNVKRREKGKKIVGCFICCLATYITSVLQSHPLLRLFKPNPMKPDTTKLEDVLISPHSAKLWYIFNFKREFKKNAAWKNLGKRYGSATTSLWNKESSQRVQLHQSLTPPSHYLNWGVILLDAPEACNRTYWAAAKSKGHFWTAGYALTVFPPSSTPTKERPQRLSLVQVSLKHSESLKNSKIQL